MAKKNRKIPGLNASSTADISFILLIFFLVTSSMDTDMGLARTLPEWDPNALEEEVKIRVRNIMIVRVNSTNEILCRGEVIDIAQLKDLAKEFIQNPDDRLDFPAKEEYELKGFGTVVTTTKHVISLQTDGDTSYDIYFKVQNELGKAYLELRDDWCHQTFGRSWHDCTEDQQSYAKAMYAMKISEAEPRR